MDIGNLIKMARIEHGLTQKQLAEAIQCSAGTIQQYELGKRVPKAEMMNRLREYLQLESNATEIPVQMENSSRRLAAYQKLVQYSNLALLGKDENIFVMAEPEYTKKEIQELRRYAEYLKWNRSQKQDIS